GLVVITQQQPISVVFSIAQVHLPKVLQAMGKETLTVEAYNDDFSLKVATGKLAALDNQIDPATLTVKIKSEFENKDRSLYPNQFVNARLLLGSLKDAIIIPTAAVQRSPSSAYAYVVKQDNTVEMRPLTLGISEGAITVVEKGLSPGEMVVTDGVDKLQNGSKVHVRQHKGKNSSMPEDNDTGMMSR
ncbi:MAG: efflux RND transporter periplasmic adaptor subunit, partial [Puniceicoccales bacterium]|nr:efflux RND transporter periplasmic adaptor subunit [Puniceicoccales bacterium]